MENHERSSGLSRGINELFRVMFTIESGITIVIFIAMTVLVLFSVLMRYVLKAPNLYGDIIARNCLVFLVFITIPMGVREKTHMNVEMLLNALPKNLSFLCRVLSAVVTTLSYACLAYLCYSLTSSTYRSGQTAPGLHMIKKWILFTPMVLAFVCACIECVYVNMKAFARKADGRAIDGMASEG